MFVRFSMARTYDDIGTRMQSYNLLEHFDRLASRVSSGGLRCVERWVFAGALNWLRAVQLGET